MTIEALSAGGTTPAAAGTPAGVRGPVQGQDAERRAEQKVVDELASTRFLRARAGGQP